MAIPRQSAVWDERRNTSANRTPPPGAVGEAERALERFRAEEPELYRWIQDGAPRLDEREHVARFGVPYERARPKRGRS